MAKKGFNRGTEWRDGKVYPPSWPCAACHHPLSDHSGSSGWLNVHIFESSEECRACNSKFVKGMKWCMQYTPMDNLSYVEFQANGQIPK
jgi:hypothetical protein